MRLDLTARLILRRRISKDFPSLVLQRSGDFGAQNDSVANICTVTSLRNKAEIMNALPDVPSMIRTTT